MYIIAQAPASAALTIGSGAATQAFNVIAGEPGAGTQTNLNAPGSNRLNGQPFIVRAAGRVIFAAGTATTAATPLQFEIAGSNTASFTLATGNVLASSTAIAAFTISSATPITVPWDLEIQFVGGGGSSLLGKSDFLNVDANGVVLGASAPVATIHSPSSILWSAEPPVQFAVGIITAAANLIPTGSTVTLDSFVLEA